MAVTPQLLDLSNRFRAQLLALERDAASAMVRYYGTVWQQLQNDVQKLQQKVDDMRAAGDEPSIGTIWQLDSTKRLQYQATEELLKFTRFANQSITQSQREAILAAMRNAPALITAAFPPGTAIGIAFRKLWPEAIEAMIGTLLDGSPLMDLIRAAVGEAADDFAEALVTGLVKGLNPRELARIIRSEFGMGLTRALRIARTEQLRAYRTATLQSYQDSNVVTGWERHAVLDERTCIACIELDGKRYKLDEPMDDHVNGRCVMLPVTLTYREMGLDVDEPDFSRELGRDWFARQDEGTQRGVLGNGMYDAWQEGLFGLSDVPQLRVDPVWGNSWQVASLGSLIGEGA